MKLRLTILQKGFVIDVLSLNMKTYLKITELFLITMSFLIDYRGNTNIKTIEMNDKTVLGHILKLKASTALLWFINLFSIQYPLFLCCEETNLASFIPEKDERFNAFLLVDFRIWWHENDLVCRQVFQLFFFLFRLKHLSFFFNQLLTKFTALHRVG